MTLFIAIWAVWFLSEILLNRLFRSADFDKKDQDKNSLRIIWFTIGIANLLGIIFYIFIRFPISRSLIAPYLGLCLIVVGMVIRFMAIWSLGKFFTVDVTIRMDHKIKRDGMYRIIRHPSYLGSLLSFLGYGLSLNNWFSLVIILLPVTMAMLNRIKIEEKVLLNRFGLEYTEYLHTTYRLIPYLY